MAIAGMNNTGKPDEIDATDYVMTIIRAIRKFPKEQAAKVEAEKITAKGEDLKLEKAYKQGYLDGLAAIDAFIQTTSRGI